MISQNLFEAIDAFLREQVQWIRKEKRLFRGGSAVILMIALVYILVGVIFQINIIHGESMNNTLKNGEIAISFRYCKTLSPGDIVILRNTDENDYIKRVVAVPGDTVDIDEQNGTLLINGKTADEPFAQGITQRTNNAIVFPMTLGEKEYFLLGDNREHSCDSRYFGAVQIDRIGGTVILPTTD